jgi:ubiquinol-cytochrome c reductase cytochrome c1 subunit
MNKLTAFFAALVLAAGAGAACASSGDLRLEPAPTNRLDVESLQRGARVFVNYCLNCHTAKYMRYNRLTDLGLTEAQIRDNLILTDAKLGDSMTVALRPSDGKAWFGAQPPDLSVQARVRGKDWLYNYFLGFYKDEKSPTGWNNLVFPNVGMPHVLWEQSGINRLAENTYADHSEAKAAALSAKGLVAVEPARHPKYLVKTLSVETPGTLDRTQYRTMVADLVNFLDYIAEPAKNKRLSLGYIVLLYLGLLFVFAYWLKREYWKDVH